MLRTVGIDPGATGYICVLSPDTGEATFFANKTQAYDLYHTLRPLVIERDPKIYIEDVHSLYGMSAKSNFQFGRNLGVSETIINCTGATLNYVTPKVWQAHIGAVLPKDIKKDRQKILKQLVAERCKALYPDVVIHGKFGGLQDGKSDALMIAHYAITH